jgi:XTP/dITP diphosphohydrolase
MKLLIATRNRHKFEEIKDILQLPEYELLCLADFPHIPEIEEDGNTIMSNAVKKAVIGALATKLWTIADDTALEIEALGGRPGVHSARYAGIPVNYEANNAKVLREMSGVKNRKAVFRCVIALADPSGYTQIVEAECHGTIAYSPSGTGGFGYDSIFIPDGYSQTFAEMDFSLKNKISHRALALQKAREKWLKHYPLHF